MSQKYQREIEEILQQVDSGAGKPRLRKPGFFSTFSGFFKRSLGGKTFAVTAGRIMVVAACLMLSALVLNVFSSGLVGPIAWAGLILFIVGYAMFFLKPKTVEKRWRGQPVEDNDRKRFGRKK